MDASTPILLVSGLVEPTQVLALRAFVAASRLRASVILAEAPSSAGGEQAADCLDLTAILTEGAFEIACRQASSGPQKRVLVRDHQLGFKRMVAALNQHGLRSIVLSTSAAYDADPAWITDGLTALTTVAAIDLFVLDIFCDVEDSWNFFSHKTREDELGPADLRSILAGLPALLGADLRPDNAREVANFTGARGLLLACDALAPRAPAERHVLPFDAIAPILARWSSDDARPG